MKTTHVSYRRLVSRPNFQHEAIEATALVEWDKGDLPEVALDNLKKWVNKELNAPAAHTLSDEEREQLHETARMLVDLADLMPF